MNNMHLANLALIPQRMQILLLQRQRRLEEERAQRQLEADLNIIGQGVLGERGIWDIWNFEANNLVLRDDGRVEQRGN